MDIQKLEIGQKVQIQNGDQLKEVTVDSFFEIDSTKYVHLELPRYENDPEARWAIAIDENNHQLDEIIFLRLGNHWEDYDHRFGGWKLVEA